MISTYTPWNASFGDQHAALTALIQKHGQADRHEVVLRQPIMLEQDGNDFSFIDSGSRVPSDSRGHSKIRVVTRNGEDKGRSSTVDDYVAMQKDGRSIIRRDSYPFTADANSWLLQGNRTDYDIDRQDVAKEGRFFRLPLAPRNAFTTYLTPVTMAYVAAPPWAGALFGHQGALIAFGVSALATTAAFKLGGCRMNSAINGGVAVGLLPLGLAAGAATASWIGRAITGSHLAGAVCGSLVAGVITLGALAVTRSIHNHVPVDDEWTPFRTFASKPDEAPAKGVGQMEAAETARRRAIHTVWESTASKQSVAADEADLAKKLEVGASYYSALGDRASTAVQKAYADLTRPAADQSAAGKVEKEPEYVIINGVKVQRSRRPTA